MVDYDVKLHLSFIREAVNRSEDSSSNCKKLALTIFFASSIFSSVGKIPSSSMIVKAFWASLLMIIVVLWYFDSEYERKRRLYCRLYDTVRSNQDNSISPYDMSIEQFNGKVDGVFRIMFSVPTCCIYLLLFSSIYSIKEYL